MFPKLDAPKRTDADFRNKVYFGNHQKALSPILELPIDIIQDFPVGDALHLLDAGITKRLLIEWIEGKLGNIDAKWSKFHSGLVSRFIASIKAPAEIRRLRAVRDFSFIHKWKSIEFRNFGLYIGIIVLKKNLKDYIYNHFLLYFCAITIFSCKYHLQSMFQVGEKCIEYFLQRFKVIYGVEYFTSNIHNLRHLSDDVKRFGALNTFSTYPFESRLYTIRRLLRTGNLPLAQAAKRILEQDALINEKSDSVDKPTLKKHSNLKLDSLIAQSHDLYERIELPLFIIDCTRDEDRWFLTKNKQILEVHFIVTRDNSTFIYGQTIKDAQNYFDTPVPSSILFIYSSENLIKDTIRLFPISDIICKMFKFVRKEEFILYEDDKKK